MNSFIKSKKKRISQGDIYQDVEFIEYAIQRKGIIDISKIIFPYVIVLTQDCDLNQDYGARLENSNTTKEKKEISQDKILISAIVAPLYNYEHFIKGDHLSNLNMKMQNIKSKSSTTREEILKQNNNPRYHYLKFPDDIQIVNSVIDFKHYFTVNIEYLKLHRRRNYVCQIAPLYREHVSLRFSNFLSRIGLP